MQRQSKKARPIEILSVTAGKVRIRDRSHPVQKMEDKPVVLLTYRPDPANSPRSEIVAVTLEQAARLHEDLGRILDAGDNLAWSN